MKKSFVFSLLILVAQYCLAQTNYHFFVQFHDKNFSYIELDQPSDFLSQRSLDRRKNMGLMVDSLDLPVSLAYLDNIKDSGLKIEYVTKWLNGVVITVQDTEVAYRLKIKFYVDSVAYLGKSEPKPFIIENPNKLKWQTSSNSVLKSTSDSLINEGYNLAHNQIDMIKGIPLHKAGYKGENMLIAVFDAGFSSVNSLTAFEHLFKEDKIKGTYDLVDGGNLVYDDNDHGMNVLGVMAANKVNEMIGTAPNADYLLFRTESKAYENLLEELNWIRAAEIADSLGVDVINSSLGYNKFDEEVMNHTHNELDGKTAFISIGAGCAASRGILVVNASGNDGNKSWEKINFPADAIGILTVGAVNKDLVPTAFSSLGPTADYRIKPEIAALGYQTTITTTFGFGNGNGTSFSSPVIAGMMACLMQIDRSKTPSELIDIILRTGHIYTKPDNVIGYGVPDFYLAYTMLGKNQSFDYNITQTVYNKKDTLKNGEGLFVHVPKTKQVDFKLKVQKKFLFIPYQKTLSNDSYLLESDGFIYLKIKHPKPRIKQNITVYLNDASESDQGQLYKASFVLINK